MSNKYFKAQALDQYFYSVNKSLHAAVMIMKTNRDTDSFECLIILYCLKLTLEESYLVLVIIAISGNAVKFG